MTHKLSDAQAKALAALQQGPLYAWIKRDGTCRQSGVLWSSKPHDSAEAYAPRFKTDVKNVRAILRAAKMTPYETDLKQCCTTETLAYLYQCGYVQAGFTQTGIAHVTESGLSVNLSEHVSDRRQRNYRAERRAREASTTIASRFSRRVLDRFRDLD